MSRDFFKSALGDLGTHVKNVTTDDGQFITAYVIDYVSNPADLSKEKFKVKPDYHVNNLYDLSNVIKNYEPFVFGLSSFA